MKKVSVLTFLLCAFNVVVFAQYRVITLEQKQDINVDLHEFLDLFPIDKITSIVKDYMENDKEVQANWEYIQSKFFQQQIKAIEQSPEFKKVVLSLQQIGLNIPLLIAENQKLLVQFSVVPPGHRTSTGLRGLLMSDIKPLIPVKEMKILAAHKYVFSAEFRRFIRVIRNEVFRNDVQALFSSSLMKNLEKDAVKNGVNVKAINEFVGSFQFLYNYLQDL